MIESPQDRRQRRHLEDMSENPDRHFFNKDIYTQQEMERFCWSCWEDEKSKFESCYRTLTIHRIEGNIINKSKGE